MKFKINGATPKGGKTICLSCKQAQIVKSQNCQELIACKAGIFYASSGIVPWKVAECSSYHPTNVPWLHEMEQIAWKVEARKRGPSGFQVPEGEDVMEVVISKPRNGYSADPSED